MYSDFKGLLVMSGLLVALVGATAYTGFEIGVHVEASRIQATCEDDNGSTILNGTKYVCLSQRQIQLMQQSRGERGA